MERRRPPRGGIPLVGESLILTESCAVARRRDAICFHLANLHGIFRQAAIENRAFLIFAQAFDNIAQFGFDRRFQDAVLHAVGRAAGGLDKVVLIAIAEEAVPEFGEPLTHAAAAYHIVGHAEQEPDEVGVLNVKIEERPADMLG